MTPTEEGKLSKDEVDALLQATESDELPDEPPEQPQQRRVQNYNFSQPSRFNRSQLEKLRGLHEELASGATRRASQLLRGNVTTQLVSMDQMVWQNLADEAAGSVVGFVFVMNPLGYRGLVLADSRFAAAALERMMGSVPNGQDETPSFSPVDIRVLAAFLDGFIEPLPGLWRRIGQFQAERGEFVEDLHTLDLFQPDADFLQVTFLMQTNAGSGQVRLSVPFEAVRELPPQNDERTGGLSGADEEVAADLRKNLEQTMVEVAALLGWADIKVSHLLRAEKGDVIVLNRRVGEEVDVRVNDKVKFRGLPGSFRGSLAVQLIMEE